MRYSGRRRDDARMSAVPIRPTATWREVGALILLPFGGVVLLVGWFAGVILLWVSDAWTTRDKVIGTLLLPGGVVGPYLAFMLAGSSSGSTCIGRVGGPPECTGGGTPVWPVVLGVLLVLTPLATDAYLLWRLRHGRRAP